MSFGTRFILSALACCLSVTLTGCSPSGQSQLDEEKEPHFVLAKSRVNAMDYDGAIEAFQESLEVNPRSASAHFQLACLYDTKISDPAAAIYHYQEKLRLDPNADNAEVIKQRIYSCKQLLAADVLPLPSSPAAQRQLEDLVETNRELQLQVARLQEVVRQWNAYFASQQAAARTNVAPPANPGTLPSTSQMPDDISPQLPSTTTPTLPKPAPAKSKAHTHTVAAGETPAAIARKYGVKLDALLAANPGLVPTHLRVGQIINLPSSLTGQ
jgi:LysM repeat protein